MSAATQAASPPRFEFDCHACERIDYAATPDLPEGWTADEVGEFEIGQAYCPDCTDHGEALS